jgi:hypothetical protein
MVSGEDCATAGGNNVLNVEADPETLVAGFEVLNEPIRFASPPFLSDRAAERTSFAAEVSLIGDAFFEDDAEDDENNGIPMTATRAIRIAIRVDDLRLVR